MRRNMEQKNKIQHCEYHGAQGEKCDAYFIITRLSHH